MQPQSEMTAGDLCTRDVITAEPGLSIQGAARLMRDHHVGDLVIVGRDDRGRVVPAGLVTDRDLVVGVLALDVEHIGGLTLGDLARGSVVCIADSASLTDAVRMMAKHEVRRLPVVSAAGTLVGILTADDVYEALAEALTRMTTLPPRQRLRESVERR